MEDTGVFEEELLCRAEFTVTATKSVWGTPLQFTDASFFGVTEWSWDFGDGTSFSGSRNWSKTHRTSMN